LTWPICSTVHWYQHEAVDREKRRKFERRLLLKIGEEKKLLLIIFFFLDGASFFFLEKIIIGNHQQIALHQKMKKSRTEKFTQCHATWPFASPFFVYVVPYTCMMNLLVPST